MTFTIYPAIDLRQGRVVRLQLGDPTRQTTFSDDPAAIARRWLDAGAEWLHVVNLDGAFDEQGLRNWEALQAVAAAGGKVQFGGGVRSLKDVARAINRGAERVILGTAAVEDPDVVAEALDAFGPERIAVSIDARDGVVRTRGWQVDGGTSAEDLALTLCALGVRRVVYTDISRDGVLSGVNVEATEALARSSGLEVIASGGVGSLEDVGRLLEAAPAGIGGVIIGRALYEGQVDLAEALRLAAGEA
jgi:phosphoribosylformimino-5-aminoimidazole carboxamide ribotide isomerase